MGLENIFLVASKYLATKKKKKSFGFGSSMKETSRRRRTCERAWDFFSVIGTPDPSIIHVGEMSITRGVENVLLVD